MSGERTTIVIDHAVVEWGASAELAPHSSMDTTLSPRSPIFDDVYFSGDGPAETDFVFLRGNNLPERFEHAERFHIGELGFGTGLNFLVTWDRWLKTKKPTGAKLHFMSVEGFPLSPDDLEKAHKAWPELSELTLALRQQLPPALPGYHQLSFGDDVTLTLFYGNGLDGLRRASGQIDAWFLDGFAPSKNPDMWSEEIFTELARLSAKGASFATFTVAGMVRRNLESAGFAWKKIPGHGRKKHMLVGTLTNHEPSPQRASWYTPASPLKSGANVAIIGGGIAGASLAYELRRTGFSPTVFESVSPANGASGNIAGLIMPRLDVGDFPAGRFHISAYVHTLRLLDGLSYPTLFMPCGAKLYAATEREAERHQKLVDQKILPEGWIEQHADGLYFPQAGVVTPPHFVSCLLGDTPVVNERVTRLDHSADGWSLETDQNAHRYDAVIIANGLDALRFTQIRGLPLTGSAGQIEHFTSGPMPNHIHVTGPYAAPSPGGGLVIGATYEPIALGAQPISTNDNTQANIESVGHYLPHLVRDLGDAKSRASVRCTTPDQLPVAGPLPDWGFYAGAYDGLRHGRRENLPAGSMLPNLFVLTALGSRGLVTAPYVAAMMVAEMANSPAPADHEIYEAIHPARFFIRDLKRGSGRTAAS
ncbi:bifunctional tRNA (5-methylaminomethyl-2-thiouridine)(34)-methyltransferase MnmD/FAD-dependent 5-carboxymethylaminomethyl-2-thiouridine(34) oxidoreductase MnmC [Hyphococcus lacteus]|uniref:tRNA 5-methylaminomethyl-2-thiouridine biosynthesis bifunctional protein MnmC n=1 Tax=Hyphococcus lacteus TaxID=3143536 RepID=A0ABV3Z3R7_9PROT